MVQFNQLNWPRVEVVRKHLLKCSSSHSRLWTKLYKKVEIFTCSSNSSEIRKRKEFKNERLILLVYKHTKYILKALKYFKEIGKANWTIIYRQNTNDQKNWD